MMEGRALFEFDFDFCCCSRWDCCIKAFDSAFGALEWGVHIQYQVDLFGMR